MADIGNGHNGWGRVAAGVTGAVLAAVMGVTLRSLYQDVIENRADIRELRNDLKEIQRLAAERGKTIPDLQRRNEDLELRVRELELSDKSQKGGRR